MDYQFSLYPSSEPEIKNIKGDNVHKQIKTICENKLSLMYRKSFDAAVKKYNERVTSGRTIDNYLKALSESNVPVLYKLILSIRYEPVNKDETSAVQKALTDFKKVFDAQKELAVVAAYFIAQNEYRELQIFFYPVCSGFMTGIETRSDLIGVTKQLTQTSDERELNIVQAVSLFLDYLESLFEPINNGQFLSQEQLEAMATQNDDNDPLLVHAVAIGTLRGHINGIQKVSDESKRLENMIQGEIERIRHDIVWSRKTEQRIVQAEEQRKIDEALEEQRKKEEEIARKAYEAQKREEDRLREEARRIEAEKLAEQARRNIEMYNKMSQQISQNDTLAFSQVTINGKEEFELVLRRHLKWQDFYGITEDFDYKNIPSEALSDPRRINFNGVNISNVSIVSQSGLVGASFKNCSFSDCELSINLNASVIDSCTFINSNVSNTIVNKCELQNIKMDRANIVSVILSQTTVISSNFSRAIIENVKSVSANNYVDCDYSNAHFENSIFRGSNFTNCIFTGAEFVSCDMRSTVYDRCKIGDIKNNGSIFRGSQQV